MPVQMREYYEEGRAAWHRGASSVDCDHLDWIAKAFWKYGWVEAQREWYEAHDRDR